MKYLTILFLAFGVALGALADSSPDAAAYHAVPPVLRAGVFNTTGTGDAPYVSARVAAMSTALPATAQAENLDALCLTELREPTLRDIALQGFRSNPNWYVYHPAPKEQPGCQNACINRLFSYYGMTLPLNRWAQFCALNPIPGVGASCSNISATEFDFQSCIADFCPLLAPELEANNNWSCGNCMEDARPGEDFTQRTLRCGAIAYNFAVPDKCVYGYGGQAGGTLVSRYPFIETDYREFTGAAPNQPGLANRGITYGKIQTTLGPVHLFCSTPATSTSGLDSTVANPLNAVNSQEVLDYIQAKANGETAIFLADTGSGPAVASSPTGPAIAQSPGNFALLQSGLTDALLANLDANSQPLPAAACTYGCGGSTPDAAGYVDHVMTSGRGTLANGYNSGLSHRRGGTLFTAAVVSAGGTRIPLSEHYGVRTDISLSLPFTLMSQTLQSLQALLPTLTKPRSDKVKNAIEHLTRSLNPKLWVDGMHLTKDGTKVFDEAKNAVHDLKEVSPLLAITTSAIRSLVADCRSLALVAISESTKKPAEIQKAQQEIAKGDANRANGKFEEAVGNYKSAWGLAT